VARNRRLASSIELPVVGGPARPVAPPKLLTYFDPVAAPAPPRPAPNIYDAYVGQYEVGPSFIITVTRGGESLFGEAPGQPKVELSPRSDDRFSVKGTDMHVTFIRGQEGQTTGLILSRGGRNLEAKKIR
jgi:hypothetical protein